MRVNRILAVAAAVVLCALVVIYLILATLDYNTFKPRIADVVYEATGRKLHLNGDIDLKVGLAPTFIVNEVAFENAAWGSQKDMASVKSLEVKIALLSLIRGHVNIRRITAIEPLFLLEINKKGRSNIDFKQPDKKPTAEKPKEDESSGWSGFSFQQLQVEKAAFTYNDHRSGSQQSLHLNHLGLKRSASRELLQVELNAAYNEYAFAVSGDIGPFKTMFDPNTAWPLDITIAAPDTTVSIKGKIKDLLKIQGVDLQFDGRRTDLASFEQITDDPIPLKGPVSVSGHLMLPSLKRVTVSDLKLKLSDSSLTGTITVDTTRPIPQISAHFKSKQLDLRPILAGDESRQPEDKKSNAPRGRNPKVFSAETLPLEGLHRVNADMSLEVVQALLPRVALDNLKIKASLQNGQFKVKPFEAGIGGGSLSVELELVENAADTLLSAEITAQKINLGNMLKKLEISDAMEGVFDLDVGLRARGNTVAAIMAGLDGDAIARLGEGKLPTDYLNIFGADLGTALLRLLNPFGEKMKRARINCVVADFHIKDGLAQSDIILIDDPRKTLLGKAEVNLKTEEIDVWIEPKPKEGIGTEKTGKVSISMKALTKPFKLGGTLAGPSLELDTVQTATTVGAALLGPVGWAWLVFSRSSGDEEPCAFAHKIAAKGPYQKKKKR